MKFDPQLSLWYNQSSSIEAQQSDQPELQITLQEVISMIDSIAHEETMGDDVRHEEMMGDDVRREETMTDEMQQWFDWLFRISICYKRSCSSPELRPQLCGS